MKSYRFKIMFLIFFAVLSVIIFAGCGMREIKSRWLDREVTIDGIDDGKNGNMPHFILKKRRWLLAF